MIPRAWIALLLAALLIAVVPSPALADTVWDEPVRLSDDESFAWFPESQSDPAGATRLVWEATRHVEDDAEPDPMGSVIVLSERTAQGWSAPAPVLVKDIFNAGRPIIASDGRYLHMLVRYVPPSQNLRNIARIYYTRAPLGSDPANAHSWSEPKPLTTGGAYWAQIVILPDGSLVTLYNQGEAVESDGRTQVVSRVYSRRSDDAGESWQAPLRLSSGSEHAVRNSLAVAPDGKTLIAVWDLGYDNLSGQGQASGIEVVTSPDAGRTWSDPQTFSGQYQQSVVAMHGTDAVLVYRSTTEDRLLFRVSHDLGATWSDESEIPGAVPRPFPGDHNFDKLSLAVDGNGRVLLAYVGTDPDAASGLSIFLATYDGAWAPPERVVSPEGYPEHPRLSVELGNRLHIVYFVRDDPFDTQEATVWAMSGQSDARAIPPANVEPALAPEQVPALTVPTVQLSAPTPPPAPATQDGIEHPSVRAAQYSPLLVIAGGTFAVLLAIIALYAVARVPWSLRRD